MPDDEAERSQEDREDVSVIAAIDATGRPNPTRMQIRDHLKCDNGEKAGRISAAIRRGRVQDNDGPGVSVNEADPLVKSVRYLPTVCTEEQS